VSLPDSDSNEPRGVLVRRQRNSVYTVLLLIALLAIIIGCLIMVLELSTYDFQFSPTAMLHSPSGSVPTTLHLA
jgi:hypothetical protein